MAKPYVIPLLKQSYSVNWACREQVPTASVTGMGFVAGYATVPFAFVFNVYRVVRMLSLNVTHESRIASFVTRLI